MIKKEDLDKRICDIYKEPGTNTLREWIRESEQEFGMKEKDLDNMIEKELNEYIELLEYLWEK